MGGGLRVLDYGCWIMVTLGGGLGLAYHGLWTMTDELWLVECGQWTVVCLLWWWTRRD